MSDFTDMRSKAKLVVDTTAGCLDEADFKAFEDQHFNVEYTQDCTAEQIVQNTRNQLLSAAMMLELEPITEDTLSAFVDSEEKDICKKALDYLIGYAKFTHGGLLCYEMQKALRDFMVTLGEMEGTEPAAAEKVKAKELGAAQQMAKALLLSANVMKARKEEEYVWLGATVTRVEILRRAKEIAGRCLAARTLHGNSCCNVFAACAVSKIQAIALHELGEEAEARRYFLRTLKLFKEGRGPGADPRADKNLKDLYDTWSLNAAVGARVAACSLSAPEPDTECADAEVPPEDLHLCVVCQQNKADVVYSACGHMCLCRECSGTKMLPGHSNPLDECPICWMAGPRVPCFFG
jgi:hypothetical protein